MPTQELSCLLRVNKPTKDKDAKSDEDKDGEEESEKFESKFVPCPICNSSVSKATINAHIDACLNSDGNKPTPKGISITLSNTFPLPLLLISHLLLGINNSNDGFVVCELCKGTIAKPTYASHLELCSTNTSKRKRKDEEDQSTPKISFGAKKQLKFAPLAGWTPPFLILF